MSEAGTDSAALSIEQRLVLQVDQLADTLIGRNAEIKRLSVALEAARQETAEYRQSNCELTALGIDLELTLAGLREELRELQEGRETEIGGNRVARVEEGRGV